MAQSLKVEAGVIAMYASTEQTNPHTWVFFEIYADEEAYQHHRQTPHFNDYIRQTSSMLQEKHYIDVIPAYLANQGNLNFAHP